MLTRIFDLIMAFMGLWVLALLYPVVALLIKFDSKGPVFYKCRRVGLGGRIFLMYKFRTMYETPRALGPSVSPLGDPRVTAIGRLLRRSKLNELPQFINLFKGEMTLIGPRPEAPDLAAAYPEKAKRIFTVKPGLIGPNQIMGRNEEELYPPGADPVTFYIGHILPKKLPVDLQYLESKSFSTDLKYLFQAVWAVLFGAIKARHLVDNWRQILLFLGDMMLCLGSLGLAHVLRYEGWGMPGDLAVLYRILPLAVLVRLPVFFSLGFYHTLIRHLSLFDIKRLIKGTAFSSIVLMAVAFAFNLTRGYSRGVFLIDWFCLTTLLVGYRGLAWMYRGRQRGLRPAAGEKNRVLIWGAGDCGELCLSFLEKEKDPAYEVVGFIDDDSAKRGKKIHGVKILGDRHHLSLLSQLYQVQQVFVAIAAVPLQELQRILQACRSAGLRTELFLAKPDVARQLNFDSKRAASANGYSSIGGAEILEPVSSLR